MGREPFHFDVPGPINSMGDREGRRNQIVVIDEQRLVAEYELPQGLPGHDENVAPVIVCKVKFPHTVKGKSRPPACRYRDNLPQGKILCVRDLVKRKNVPLIGQYD